MKKLTKKTFRDIRINKSQFITIFLMVFLGVFVFSGIHSYMDGMKQSADNYYKNNNLQDLWLSGVNFTKKDLEDVKNIENVKNAERILNIRTKLENFDDISLDTNFIETNEISKMYVVDGESFDKDKKGVWIDSYLAKNLNLKVGDEITFSYENYKITEKILGLVTTPDHVYIVKDDSEIFPNHKNFGYVYLSIAECPIYDIISEDYIFNSIIVDVDDTSKLDETKADIENKIESAIAVTDREASASYVTYNSEIEEGQTYSSVFTAMFLFIAILSVITTMNRFVKKQRTQIGTLKALGFKNRKIVKHYISYGFFISIFASVMGIIVGNLVLGGFFMHTEMSYFEIPVYSTVIVPFVYILAVITVLLITAVTYLSCRKVLKEPAVEALRTEVPNVKASKFELTTKGIFKKLALSSRWNLRDITRNKARTAMGVVGVIGCTMLIVCAFGMLDTMNSYLNWQFDELYNFKYKLSISSTCTEDELTNITNTYGNQTSETLGIEIKKSDDTKETNIITINDASEYLRYSGHNKKFIKLKDDGVYITEKLAGKLGLNVGDEITWHVFGDSNWYTTKITGLNRDPQSQSLSATRKYTEELGIKYKPDSIYTNKDMSGIEKIDGIEIIQGIQKIKEGMESMLETTKTMVIILIVVSAILGFVIIYNLGVLSFSEKQYQFATLKVLGFKNKQIKKIFVKQNIWITIVGIIIGLPLGFLMLDYVFKNALGDNYDFSVNIRLISYLYASIGTAIVSLVVNHVLAKKVKTIDMVSSLKANE